MALRKLPFKHVRRLIGVHLSTKEEEPTRQAIDELSAARKRGYLTKQELIKVCKWKSPRSIRHIRRNRASSVQKATRAAFTARSEQKKLLLLKSLHGVSVPMASSILTLTNPRSYGVIDIRTWQLLHAMGSVRTHPDGAGFNVKQWLEYLQILRYFARRYRVGARDIERTLFNVHVRYQSGRLYKY